MERSISYLIRNRCHCITHCKAMPLKERDRELVDNDLCLKHIKALLLELEVLIKKITGLESN